MKKIFYVVFPLLALILLVFPQVGVAQELWNEDRGIWHGKVVEIITDEIKVIPGTDTEHLYQTIKVEVLDGPKEGEIIIIENDYLELSAGNKFYFKYSVYIDGSEVYGVISIDRLRQISNHSR